MKQSEIATIVLVASISVISAFFIANAAIGQPEGDNAKVRTTTEITSDIVLPDQKIFNNNAINPTIKVEIGGDKSQ
ncbi:hypothetical protein KC953_02650 [Candidatus Saccharibacteria bacterium]|nr:hypothetical protein [Candidatus Saccharibacteria bacterium]